MKKKMALAALAAVSVLGLSACGSDNSTEDTTTTTTVAESTTTVELGNIVEVASANTDFETLVAAVSAAGLGETLSGAGPFTVFAPTDAAFEALPAGVLEKLLLPKNKETLVKILTYHVLASKVMAADVTAGKVATVEGSEITIDTMSGVKVDGATVTATDIPASNGVIHVIDEVLIPASVDVTKL